MKYSRRDFVLASGGVVLGASVLGADEPLPTQEEQARYSVKTVQIDVLVAGGGLAGVCAAIAAARNGASVIFVQDRSRLGGNSSSEIRMHVCGANHSKALARWRETGLIEELKLTEAAANPQRSFHVWDLILYDKVVSEPNITLLLDTAIIEASLEGDRIAKAIAISPLLEARYEIEAKFFIDCTGDGKLAAAAGAKYMRGREGREVYGESLAPEQSDAKTMGNSLMFFAKRHDQPMPFTPPAWARKFTPEDFKHRSIHSWEYGYWWIEWGGELDTISDNQQIRHELMRILLGVWDYIKNGGQHPDSANWALDFVGMIPGKRESRRILGEHVMIQPELERAEPYQDRVAYGGWPMDDHPPGGMDSKDLKPATQIHFEQPYSIPLRSLYSVNRPNLLMAGRNISASHVAFSSTRVMATCATMGQAAGTAAAYCAKNHCLPKDVVADAKRMQAFHQILLRDDQALLGIQNEDEQDLARTAKITCSGATPEGSAQQIIDGWNRDIGDGQTHQWRAEMSRGEPWIQLEWDTPQRLQTVQITFDSGLHRRLFLSGEDSVYFSQTRGIQPELVASYTLEALVNGSWKTIAQNDANYLRMVRHRFDPVETKALRIRIQRTHGDSLVRVFEVRC
ncbi:MAG TPA: FAD-dependent oxidoreductase [Candidatus Hydrogenedentes bacterium]|nr:FAD-dependent oxidoreductase [Candidatus Hydrogenedentota bacterium]